MGPPIPGPKDSQTRLFVSEIPRTLTNVDVFEIFSKMGRCQVNLMSNPMRLYQSAIITYDAAEQADAALDKFRPYKVNDKYLRILNFEQDRSKLFSTEGNIFIRDLPRKEGFNMEQFYSTFRAFGAIYSFKVGFNLKGASLGYAFVRYKSIEVAEKLLEMGKLDFDGQTITIERYQPPKNPESKVTNNLYVKNFKPTLTEEELRKFFEPYGTLVSVALREGKHGKIGFVCFEKQADAVKAVSELHGKINKDIGLPEDAGPEAKSGLYVQPHQKKEQRELFKLRELEMFKRQWQRHNLYVKFIPQEWDEDRLEQEFAEFGEIKSKKIVKKQGQDGLVSTGVGYVCFKNQESAQHAIEGIKEKGGSLYVAMFESKQTRQRKLQKKFDQQQSSLDQFLKLLSFMLNQPNRSR